MQSARNPAWRDRPLFFCALTLESKEYKREERKQHAKTYDRGDPRHRRQRAGRNGGAVIYDGECATLKRVDVFDDMVKLSPVNPEYQPKELKGADMETYRILGVPRMLIREIS